MRFQGASLRNKKNAENSAEYSAKNTIDERSVKRMIRHMIEESNVLSQFTKVSENART